MNSIVLRGVAVFGLSWLVLPPLTGASPSLSPTAGSLHFWAFDDYEPRPDHPRPAAKPLADLNVGEPGTVRLILFLPNDRPFRVGLVDSIKTAIKQSQAFFGDQMEAHGYGYKTFRFETDAQGEPLVHRVDGQHPESHYFEKTQGVQRALYAREIEQVFDLEENVYVIYRDIKYSGTGTGHRFTKKRGTANLPTWAAGWEGLSHELAHAFGLPHDYRDGAYILSYGGPSQFPGASTWDRISACAAEFLSVSPYFDSDIPIEEVSPPTIELISPTGYPGGSRSVSMKFEVSDAEGLHQVLLYTNVAYGYEGLRECRALEGRRDAVVEFEYDGSSMFADPERAITSLSDSLHSVEVRVVDTDGNVTALEFDLVPDQVVDVLKGHTDSVNTVAFSPDRTTLASGSSDGKIKLWNVSRRELIATLEGHTRPIRTVAFSRDGTLASGSWNDDVRLWDVATGSETAALQGIAPVAFSPDGTLLASGTGNRTIALWDASTLERVVTLEGHAGQINAVAFSPDGTLLASGSGDIGSEDRTVRLWDIEKREEVATLEHTGAIWSVAFSPDGAVLASAVGSPGNVVRLWDARTRRAVTRLWHSGAVLSVAFSRGASILASGFTSDRRDGKVRLYDPLTLEHIGTFLPLRPGSGGVRSLAISDDETILAAGTEYHTIELRDVSKWKRPPFPSALDIISGDAQQGAPGAALAHPLVVEVRDQYGDLLPDAAVSFTVTAGEGQLSGRFTVEHTTTDADGRAELVFTLGPQPGPNIVGVSLGGRELATFTADGVGTAVAELEGDYRTWHLPRAATARLGKGALGESDRAVALSVDGRCLAVASSIGVWLYEAATARAQALLPTETGVHSVAFSLDGILAAGLDNGGVALWGVETGERTGTLRHGAWGGVTVVFSPDGTALASGSLEQIIRLWDVETRHLAGTWEVARGSDSYWDISVTFSPDGTRLVSGFQDGTVRLWDVAAQTEVATLEGHTDRVASVAFSPDGGLLASGGGRDDPTVRLWDAASQSQIAILRGNTSEVRSLSFSSPDGATLASGSSDGTVRLWDVDTHDETGIWADHRDGIRSVTFSPNGATLVSGAADGTVLLRDLETGNTAGLSGHASSPLSSMALSPEGAILASGYLDGTVRLWDAAARTRIATLEGHTSGVTSLSFTTDGSLLASGSWDRTVKLWEVGTRELVGRLEGHAGGVVSVAFSPDGATLASAGGWNDATIRLWDVEAREQIGLLEGHTRDVLSVAFSPDGATLASGGGYDDKTVKLWDVATRDLIVTLEGHEHGVNAVAFSPEGTILASGSADTKVRLWDVVTRAPLATLQDRNTVGSVTFSPYGNSLVSGVWGAVTLWDVGTKERTATLEGHTGWVHSVGFSRYGATLASGSSDGTMLLWDMELLQPRLHTLTKVSGLEQQVPAGALAKPFVVLVRDQDGDPLAGATVIFAVTAGGGTLSVETASTDSRGRAATTLTLGSDPGRNTVTARFGDLAPVIFSATGQAIPKTLTLVSGDNQQGAVGAALADPFVVSVLDQTGAAFPGATVIFSVTAGEGTLSTTTATTDADGRASTTLTLGLEPETVTVAATVAGLDPITFTALAKTTADFDGDGETGFSDLFLFADAFGGNDPRFDLDGNGSVDFADFFLLADYFADPARGKLLALAREMIGLPDGPQLQQNAPNPFNSETLISWFLLRPGPSRVEVFALTGQRVALLHEGPEKAGVHRVHWDGRDGRGRPLASGVYLYRLVTEGNVQTRKLTLLR